MKDIKVLSGPLYNVGYTQDMVPKAKRKMICVVGFDDLCKLQERLAIAEGRLQQIAKTVKGED